MKFEVNIPDRFIAEFMVASGRKKILTYEDNAEGERRRAYKNHEFRNPQNAVCFMVTDWLIRKNIGLGKIDQVSVRVLSK